MIVRMDEKTVWVVGIFLTFSLCWWSPLLAYGQVTDPSEVTALLGVRRKLNDRFKYLNWSQKHDPCTTYWTGVKCFLNQTDGFMHVQELLISCNNFDVAAYIKFLPASSSIHGESVIVHKMRLMRLNLSGTLAPELGQLPKTKVLDLMWNNISGSIPKEIGNIKALQLLLLSGNQISGPLPDELGYLPNLTKFQLDLNFISGPIPKSFANLSKVQHFHMNNNNFSGQLPEELSTLPLLRHFLLDNNNLSGYLPPQFAQMASLTIFQLDNNNFAGSVIPNSYGNMTKLRKLSLRNCSLQGTIPDLSAIKNLLYLDLSINQLTGEIPSNRLSEGITTIILSDNKLNGSIHSNLSGFSNLQKLYLDNNSLSGSLPTTIWKNITFTPEITLDINFEDNLLSDISGILNVPSNVTLMLRGNPVCDIGNQQNISMFCGPSNGNETKKDYLKKPVLTCKPENCPIYYQYAPTLPNQCFCAAAFGVEIRLRSPSISLFPPYRDLFNNLITSNVYPKPNQSLLIYQFYIDSVQWEPGPRLKMSLLFFPQDTKDSNIYVFSSNEILTIADTFATFNIPGNDIFGPYDLLGFTAEGPYAGVLLPSLRNKAGLRKGVLAGIVVGSILGAVVVLVGIMLIYRKVHPRMQVEVGKKEPYPKVSMKMDGVKAFSFEDLQRATNNFSITTQIGQGGYGKVYKGALSDGAAVAIKRAQQGSLQGDKEFYTEIEMLSRLHHRNLVSLVGYCDEEEEQMLVYEFMPNGSLHDLLSAKYKAPLGFGTRLHIALGAARGILYLHTEADPPIIHRDIKANNILLDSKLTAKVSDFGISRLAPLSGAQGDTTAHVSTNIKGTPGYVDPEYLMTHKLTEKSDVYSLGIVFLELLTGMQPISHGRNIVREVKTACQSGMMFSIIDRSMGQYPSECVKKFMALALRCSLDETKDRPLMLEIVRELENIFAMLPVSDSTALEMNLNVSSSGTSSTSIPTFSDRRSTYGTMDLIPGSDLVSGVIPTIKPR